MADTKVLRVGVSADALLEGTNEPFFDASALEIIESHEGIEWEYLPERAAYLSADDLATYDVLCVVASGVQASALSRGDLRTRLIAGFGAGYDTRDVAALTEKGVLLTNNPDAVRRPMATTQLTFVLALAQNLMQKDQITRKGDWSEQRRYTGIGLTGRVLVSIGLGNIGRELFRVAKPFEMRHLACDPFVNAAEVAELGVELVDFDTLLRESDFLCTNVPLGPETTKLVDERALSLMKPSAFLISTSRGPIVDESALYDALVAKQIAGAAMDVFEVEPTPVDNPILALDNVVVTPHSLCHTDECNRLLAEGSFKAARSFAEHEVPRVLVNPEVLEHPRVKGWFDTP